MAHGGVHLGNRLFGQRQERAPHLRQPHMPRVAGDQPHIQPLLKLLDQQRQRRLGHMHLLRRAGEVQMLRHRHKGLEMPIHPDPLIYMKFILI